ncbi:MAG TPA: putative lipopolysaccharide heptosyltransferase III [bacterium]|nr:putative lipopolysaccharide heptosyltransferase III [bacterium]
MMASGPRRILIVKLKNIGDVLLTVPAIRALHDRYPDAAIAALVNAGTEEMLSGLPYLSRVFTYDRKRIKEKNFVGRCADELRLMRDVRRFGCDLAIDFSGGDRGALCVALSGAAVRVGFAKTGRGMLLRDRCFTRSVKPDHGKHTVEYHLDLIRAIEIEPKDTGLEIAVPESDRAAVEKVLADKRIDRRKYVVIHPASRWFFKCWRADGFAAVADHIRSRYGLTVVLTAAPDRREREMVDAVLSCAKERHADCAGLFSLKQIAALLRDSVLFLGIDSAPMHIAQAVRTPVIVLFGPSGVHNWGPRGKFDRVICRNWPCVPCGKDGCNGTKKSRCLDAITAEEVIKEVDDFFALRGTVTGNGKG